MDAAQGGENVTQMQEQAQPAARVLAWSDDLRWAAEELYARFGEVVPLDGFATSGTPNSPGRYLIAAVAVGSERAIVRLYPSRETVTAEGTCPCGHVYESHDLRGAGTATPRRQLENLMRHWRANSLRCALCEWSALEERED